MRNIDVPGEGSSLKSRHFLFILLYWLILLPFFWTWLARDQVFAPWDMADHAGMVLRLRDALLHGKFLTVYTLSKYYPPLFHILALPASFFSTHPDAFCFGSWLSLLFLMGGCLLLTERLTGSVEAGLASAFLIPGYVYISWMCRMPMTDLTLTAGVAWALWALRYPSPPDEKTRDRALGICLALGLLAKWSFLFFILLPLLVFLLQKNRPSFKRNRGIWLLPLILAGPWYARSLPKIIRKSVGQLSGRVAQMEGDPAFFSRDFFLYYFRSLREYYLSLPLLILVLGGTLFLIISLAKRGKGARENLRRYTPALAGLVGGWLILSFIANKDPRYIMPIMPVLSFLSVSWIPVLPAGVRRSAPFLFAVLGFCLVFWNLFSLAPPDQRNWRIEDLAGFFLKTSGEGTEEIKALMIPNEWHLNDMSLGYAMKRLGVNADVEKKKGILEEKDLGQYHYVLLLDPPPENTNVCPHGKENTRFMTSRDRWRRIAAFPRPDGRSILILERPGRNKENGSNSVTHRESRENLCDLCG